MFNAIKLQRRVAFLPGVPLTFKALRKKDYSEAPKTLGEHLKKRRKELGLFQREAAARLGVVKETYANWEKGKTEPVAYQFRPVVAFLEYDPSPAPTTLAERLEAKRRATGMRFSQVAKRLGWDEGTLTRYLNGTWRMPADRARALEELLCADAAAALPQPPPDPGR
ncbi:MAG: helix-turn-helix domain-containing protein [Rhodospirillales bacterium]|nr:helix-turn-helix domain-containing protein [Rhodospirillales bacterium]